MDSIYQLLQGFLSLLNAAELMPDFVSARGIFCAIAWFATILSLITLTLGIFADFGSDADADLPGSSLDGATGAFSMYTVIGFLLGLGWGGYVAVQCGLTPLPSIAVGLLLGVIMFFIVAGLMRLIYSLKADGTLNYASLVGMRGTVYVTLPPNGAPGGQVQVSHPNQLITMAAVQHGSEPLPPQTPIVVVEASTTLLTVRAAAAPSSQP